MRMTQRNYQNARNQGDGPKGKSRKSAGSAKLKSKAGASVYTPSKGAKQNAAKAKAKDKGRTGKTQPTSADIKAKETAEQMRRRENAMVSMVRDMPEYKFWRRIWWILMGLAFLVIILTWVPGMMVNAGILGEDFNETASWISGVGFIFALFALIGAFYIDFRKIRKLQKQQENKARNLTKSERRELDAAIERAMAQDAQKKAERKAKRPWAKKKQDSQGSEDTPDGEQ